jgi:hypothetical protein
MTGQCEGEIRKRIGMGRTAMEGLKTLWKDKNISNNTKQQNDEDFDIPNRQ